MSGDEMDRTHADWELKQALEELEDGSPPPEPPVEAMWEAIRTELPTPGRRRARVRTMPGIVWVPALMAAGIAGLVIGRWSAPAPLPPEAGMEAVAGATEVESSEAEPPGTGGEADPAGPADPADSAGPADPTTPLDPEGIGPPAETERRFGFGFGPGPSEVEAPWADAPSLLSDYRFVTNLHLLEVGPLLTRLAGGADPEAGTVPGEVREQARALLDGTRFLLAEPEPLDPGLVRLLEDLELLLVQVVGLPAAESEATRVEIELIAEGMSEQRILPRIHTFAHGGADQ